MRRQIIILLALLLLVVPVMAQEWPDSFIGDQIHFKDAQSIQMHLISWHDRNPWGMVDMTERFFYFGTLTFDYCDEENVAILNLDILAFRHCQEWPFGTVVPPQCYYYMSRTISLSYTLVWNEETGAYLIEGSNPVNYWGTGVIALVVNSSNDSGILLMGVMNLSDLGVMVWDDNYTHYTYVIEAFTAEPLLPRPKRPSGRRIPTGKD